MICSGCAKMADHDVEELQQYPDDPAEPAKHPVGCGCSCQHRPVGSVLFERNDK